MVNTCANYILRKKKSIIFFIHQAHGQNSTEIGYLLAYWRLMKVYNLGVNYSSYKNRLGMRRLFLEQGSSVDLETFIFGANSFGALLQSQGYDALPGPDFPSSSSEI